jgi:hypothetical protein
MQSRRKMVVVAVGILMVLLFLGAVALLSLGFLEFFKAREALNAKKSELELLYAKNPFPSAANLAIETGNLALLQASLDALLGDLGRRQIEPVGQSPLKFTTQFFETRKSLMGLARRNGVKIKDDFDFGFGRHMSGVLPAPQDVPRLTQQLRIVETLCTVLFEARIGGISGLARQEFESDALAGGAKPEEPKAPRGRRRAEGEDVGLKNTLDGAAGLVPEGKLYGTWRFGMQLEVKETALLKVLDGLASNGVIAVVTRLEVVGEANPFGDKSKDEDRSVRSGAPSGGEAASETQPEVPKGRDFRVVCGHDQPMTARLDLDVYQFAKTVLPGKGREVEGVQ